MYEAVFRIELRGEGAIPTAEAGTSVELWCNDHCDLLHVRGADAPGVIAGIEAAAGVRELVEEDGNGEECIVVTERCLKGAQTDHVDRYLTRHDCLLIPPIRYAEGAKFCRVLALDGATLTAFYRDLVADHAVTVESKREIRSATPDAPLLTVDALLPTLSPRQRETFALAHERGYYEIPRRTTVAEVAAEIGVERRTAEEHLRRAENKLADALVEYL